MKKLVFIIFVLGYTTLFSQVTQGINYRFILRNNTGSLLTTTTANVEFILILF